MDQKALARKNLDKRLAALREIPLAMPARGWIRAIREALGMTTAQLAERIGVKQPRIIALEKAEANGTTTLKSLRDAAEAMDCTLVYALVPTMPLEAMVKTRAKQKADTEVARLHHSMALENQALEPGDLAAERERLVEELLQGPLGRLWDTK
ncbi:MAG: mobile mystery protein A [Parvularcula sp.]|jgi:predicted DNA-binding mobile mystery protein A|nr:mobile mystery protein A [Parvularcula sp.]